MNTDIDRDRGMLTPADRAFLLGEREMGHEQSRRNAEARVRRRVVDAILDFDLLLHTLSAKDRQQVFEELTSDADALDGLKAMLAFAYVGTDEQGLDFADVLVPAVRHSEEACAASRRGANVSVDVTFEVETSVESTLEGVAERLDAGDPVTPRELFSLVMQGEHDPGQHDRIDLAVGGEADVDDQFLERLATYLEGELHRPTPSRAVIRLSG
ncbi:hypothetical protein C491_11483 [Natronococcus amylolyticus DSM 10524]|uniref:Domain of unknown function domain-containing protein n=1 Tax=Natronococcus amylolyticus DSM 10524 TaxID=1227497 RepID=L9X5Z7_9EURY|nr:hypothetical protein [Natronococcus amylolyticus]ELY57120.1 hypothetical protein C491_11483 [Natronococcus amylolyticus DSM 10524]